MSKLELMTQLKIRGAKFAKGWGKPMLLDAVYRADGTKPPEIEKIEDIPQIYYLKAAELKDQLKIRGLQPIRGMRKKLVIERIIKQDGKQVPIVKPKNPNKPLKVKRVLGRKRTQRIKTTKKKPSFATYIYKVLKQVHPDTGISQKGMQILNDYVFDLLKRIGEEARTLCELFSKKTLSSREIQTAVRLCLPGELAKHAVSEGTKAVTKFYSSEHSGGGKTTKSFRAGLQFPVGRIRTYLKNGKFADRIGKGAPVYLAAVVEYMAAEVLELAGNAARDNKKARIIPRHISLAVRNDEELNKLLRNVYLPSAGVLPNVHAVLLPKKIATSFPEEGSVSLEY